MTLNFARTLLPFAVATALATFAFGCGKPAPAPVDNAEAADSAVEAAEAPADAHAGHDHAGHDHEGHDHAGHGHEGHDHGLEGHSHDHAAEGGEDIMDLVLAEGSFDPSAVVRQPGAKIGDITRCPVSGEAFTVTDAHPHVTHEGQEVYFCCPGCIRRFQRNAQRYLDEQP